jgi:hypothetical protein
MRVASDILPTDPDFNGVYDMGLSPVAPAFVTPRFRSAFGGCGLAWSMALK